MPHILRLNPIYSVRTVGQPRVTSEITLKSVYTKRTDTPGRDMGVQVALSLAGIKIERKVP